MDVWIANPWLQKAAYAGLGVLFVLVLVKVLRRSVSRRVEDPAARYRARKMVTLAGYFLTLVLLAALFSERVGELGVALGVVGAGIAFALQEVIASVAGWVAISFGSFFRPGDRVQLGSIRGDVIDVSILRTTLMECGQWVDGDLYNGRIVRIANSFVFKEPVFNYSADFPFLWDEIKLGVKYGSDYRLARELLQRVGEEVTGDYAASAQATWQSIARKYMIEEAAVEPLVTVVATDNWMAYTLRYVVDYRLRRRTKDLLFSRLMEEIDKTQNRVQVASSSIELVKVPALEVILAEGKPRPGSRDDVRDKETL